MPAFTALPAGIFDSTFISLSWHGTQDKLFLTSWRNMTGICNRGSRVAKEMQDGDYGLRAADD